MNTTTASTAPAQRKRSGPSVRMVCPECGEVFQSTHHRQAFCTPAHKAAFQDRDRVRGRQMAQLVLAWRMGRNVKIKKGEEPSKVQARKRSAAKSAFSELCRLADKFNAEDVAAGRPGALHTIQVQAAMGFRDPVVTGV